MVVSHVYVYIQFGSTPEFFLQIQKKNRLNKGKLISSKKIIAEFR